MGAVRDRWQLFAGAVVAVALGVGLVQSALQVMAATDRPVLPAGLTGIERAHIRDGYAGAATLLGMTVMLAVFLTVFIVSTTFGFTVVQRRRELALLRLVGAQRGSLRLMLLGEAVLLGLVGTAVGVPVGLLGTFAQSKLLVSLGMLPQWFIAPWDPGALYAAAIVGVSTAVVGVFAAAWRASRISALEALSDLPEGRPVMTGWRWFWGLSAAVSTAALVAIAQAAGDLVAGLTIALLVMVSGSVALSQLSPVVVPWVGRLPALVLRGSVVADLARANVLHAVRRSAATAAPLIVLAGLLLGLWGTFGSLAKAVGEEQRQLITADLVVPGEVASTAGIAVASPQTIVPISIRHNRRTTYSEAIGIDPTAWQQTHKLRPRKGSLARLAGAAIAIGPGMSAEGYKLNSVLAATIDGRTVKLKVVAILPETLDVGDNFFVPRALTPAGRTETLVKLADGADLTAAAHRLGGRTVADWAQSRGEAQQRGNTAIFAVLMGLSGVYAAVAVVNAIVMSTADRRREFAQARMAGLTRPQVLLIALLESLTVVLVGVLLGCIVAAAALAGIATGTASTYGVVVVAIPWRLLALILGGSLIVVGSTAATTAWLATKPQPITLLSGRE
ncbi:ABC transporter permease [Kribbella ginsengisoli]|uniref:ABC3 transporter permease C-terminal domain-containing protein n=1 Tax=Kribbella ginsengisoli TaxID=363865 RepID=A0ABP6WYF9_9ACTN